jgi:hypothetical protein
LISSPSVRKPRAERNTYNQRLLKSATSLAVAVELMLDQFGAMMQGGQEEK